MILLKTHTLWLTLLLLSGLASCKQLAQLPADSSIHAKMTLPVVSPNVTITHIRDLQQTRVTNVTVHLNGKVGKQVPLAGMYAYELQDATGTIWVLTTQAAPQAGDEVLIKGTVRYQSISLEGKDRGELYIEEQEKLTRTATPSPTPQT